MTIRQGDWAPIEDAELLRCQGQKMRHADTAAHLARRFGRRFSVDAVQKRIARLRARGEADAAVLPGRGHGFGQSVSKPPAELSELDEAFEEEPKTEPRIRVTDPTDEDGGPLYVPRPPRGPTTSPHYIPEGHELGGVSTLTDANGDVDAQWSKTRVAGADQPPVAVPESFLLKRASVMSRGDGKPIVQWASYERDAVEQWEATKGAVAAHVAEYVRPVDPVPEPRTTEEKLLVAYPLGDPHIGMLAWADEVGESFDLDIAERELTECMRQLVARSPAAKEAIVCNLGDFWHAQDDRQVTPKSGNKLDVDGRAGKVGRVGLRLFRTLIDTALRKHEHVRVRSIPGNHDPQAAIWLPLFLQAVYENEPRVTVEDGFAPYQFDRWGKVLLGWCHGDGAKMEALAEIMAADVPELWGATTFREFLAGHIHHRTVRELRGCTVRTFRTLAGRDAWHHHSGYRSGRSLEAPTYHADYGLDSIAVIGVERVRAALAEAA